MSEPTARTVRAPRPQEAEEIATVHVRSWEQTYAGLVPERFYDDAARRTREQMWHRMLSDPGTRDQVRVADLDGKIIGFAAVGRPDEEHPAREHALRMLYVLRDHHGTGAGQALLDAVLGDDPAQLWVAEANPRAIRFYERNGFRADGTTFTDPALEGLPEIRMVR